MVSNDCPDGGGDADAWTRNGILRADGHTGTEVSPQVCENLYRSLFEATQTPYLVLAPDAPHFTITDVNPAYLRATMTTREMLVGRHLFEAFPDNPDDNEASGVRNLRASLERVLASRQPDTMPIQKYDIRRPDGSFEERYWSPVNAPVASPNGEILAIIHHVEDVSDYLQLRKLGAVRERETERLEAEIVAAGNRLQEANERLRRSEAELEIELSTTRQLQAISSALIRDGDTEALYRKIVDAAVIVMHSDAASMQMFHGGRGALKLLASRGFHPQSAAFWEWVRLDSGSTCGAALGSAARVTVPDVEDSAFMAGTSDLEEYRRSGIRAVQSTPLTSRNGRLLGMISTHWRAPHDSSQSDLRRFDLLARQAADLVEHAQAEEMLRDSEERLRLATEAADVGFWDFDPVNETLFWPPVVKAMFGISAEVPVTIADFYAGLHPDDLERTTAAFAGESGERFRR